MGSIEDFAKLGLGSAEYMIEGLAMGALGLIGTPIGVGFGSAERALDIIF